MPKISAYPSGEPSQVGDKFVIARGGQNYYLLGSEFMPQAGVVRNGKISVTVAGGNLTLALKTLSGADPSASNPVFFYAGGAWRAITAALSVTRNAGTNWCDAGGVLQTLESDFFAYLGYNTTDGVVIGFSRIPRGQIYSDFSTTTTSPLHCAISTITNAAAGDEYYVIGRFGAILSAGAAFTWSVPAFTALNLVQRPIYESRWLPFGYAPTNFTLGAGGTSTLKFLVTPRRVFYEVALKLGGAGLSIGANPNFVMPFTHAHTGGSVVIGTGNIVDASPAGSYAAQALILVNAMYPIVLTQISTTYVGQAFLNTTVPITWAVNDELDLYGQYVY